MIFHIEDDSLTIQFEGVERFWALKRTLVVPKAAIATLTWQEEMVIPRRVLGVRVGGAALPGGLFAGRFWSNLGKNFVYLQRTSGLFKEIQAKHVLAFELRDYPYRRLFFTLDKPDIAEQIIAWWVG